jgi:hypothetical protein
MDNNKKRRSKFWVLFHYWLTPILIGALVTIPIIIFSVYSSENMDVKKGATAEPASFFSPFIDNNNLNP